MVARRAILFALIIALAAGCGTSRPSFDRAQRNLTFDSGSPIVDAEVHPVAEGDSVWLRLTWGVIPASLIRTTATGELRSVLGTEVILRPEDGTGDAVSFSQSDTLRFESEREAASFDYRLFGRDIAVSPGSYEARIRVTDGTSGAASVSSLEVDVPVDGSGPTSCHVRLVDEAGEPVVSYHVPSESGRIDIVVTSFGSDADLRVALIRVESDTSVADPPYGLSRTRGALTMRGIRGEHVDTLEVRAWRAGAEGRELRMALDPVRSGLYRATCDVEGRPLARREFAVRHAGFPAVDRLPVMVEALEYLATGREMAELHGARDVSELKTRFDAFWAQRAPDRASAARLLERYYSRVEEANLLFSGVKEGWKTDRGMVYIMRGPPLFTERQIDRETWFYTYSDVNPADVFTFERIIVTGVDAITSNIVLVRSPVYDYEWRRLLDRWRSGAIL